ncbi:hypothetical protein LXA43DRAFT_370841 [Ganoderma leucocontextum]|nr:hypothetical protein LXA43DRAFT_370841 [Ganoderma leucocontextum]
MDSSSSLLWSVTVVRMQGMKSLRSDVRWRPEVSISFDDEAGAASHKFVLGVDGRNPNLKTLISVPETGLSYASGTRLSVEVFCRAPTAKKQGKATPLCFALVPLSDVLKERDSSSPRSRVEYEVALIRVNALRGKAAIVAHKREALKLVLRFHPPEELSSAPQAPPSKTLPGRDQYHHHAQHEWLSGTPPPGGPRCRCSTAPVRCRPRPVHQAGEGLVDTRS